MVSPACSRDQHLLFIICSSSLSHYKPLRIFLLFSHFQFEVRLRGKKQGSPPLLDAVTNHRATSGSGTDTVAVGGFSLPQDACRQRRSRDHGWTPEDGCYVILQYKSGCTDWSTLGPVYAGRDLTALPEIAQPEPAVDTGPRLDYSLSANLSPLHIMISVHKGGAAGTY
ncbi:hypothetical protein RRG08_042726 [Elysia crispata]|uniref:Uncharacterized protein n=1 Tax=Elysia crispata TaxID=231223 RepID=A0AAE1CKH7_9GAST|nr:hypothetical protein RRG08_042726 [Elysia crispata]